MLIEICGCNNSACQFQQDNRFFINTHLTSLTQQLLNFCSSCTVRGTSQNSPSRPISARTWTENMCRRGFPSICYLLFLVSKRMKRSLIKTKGVAKSALARFDQKIGVDQLFPFNLSDNQIKLDQINLVCMIFPWHMNI